MRREWPWEEVITTGEILALYDAAMTVHGGMRSAPREGCLEQCLGAAHHAEVYHAEPGVTHGLRFAAALLVYLAKDSCFADGNKRIAWSAMTFVLYRRFRLTLDTGATEAVQLVEDVLARRLEVDDVMRWLGPRLVGAAPS